MTAQVEEETLCLLLLGKTGAGKSATGNTVLGGRSFQHSGDTSSITKAVVSKFSRFDNFIMKVVDCPGLMDTDLTSDEDTEKAVENMGKAIVKCNGGVDAFILVTKRTRFTEEHKKSLEALKKIFGEKYLDNLIVVVTEGDKFREDMEEDGCGDIDFHSWCRKQTGCFRQLYEDFNDRFLLINNREKDPNKNDAQRREIIQLAHSLTKLNGRYTSTCFQEAKELQDKLIFEENLPMLNETIQTKVGLLAAGLQNLVKTPSNHDRKRILESVNDLKKEIVEKDRGTGLLNKLLMEVNQIETCLDDVDRIHELARKIEEIREEEASWSKVGNKAAAVTVVSGITLGVAGVTICVAASPVVLAVAGAGTLLAAPTYIGGIWKTIASYTQHQALSQTERQTQVEKTKLESKVEKLTV